MIKNTILSAVLCIFFVGTLAVDAKPKMYTIKGDRKNGSKFRHIEASSPVPFTQTYEEFNDKHKSIYRQLYTILTETKLEDSQIPPFPEKGLQAIYRPIIKKNKLVAKNGMVFFVAQIDETGEPKKVTVYQSPNRLMTDFINTVVFATKFTPGSCDGEPCAMEYPFEMKLRYHKKNKDITGGKGAEWAKGQ